jgi:hypothetical protein
MSGSRDRFASVAPREHQVDSFLPELFVVSMEL